MQLANDVGKQAVFLLALLVALSASSLDRPLHRQLPLHRPIDKRLRQIWPVNLACLLISISIASSGEYDVGTPCWYTVLVNCVGTPSHMWSLIDYHKSTV